MLPLIAAALPLVIEYVPQLIGKLLGAKGEKVAEDVITVAKAVTGAGDASKAAELLKADPALITQFQTRMAEIELEYRKLDTEDYKTYHETLQTDIKSEDEYVRRWRPRFANYISFTWLLMFITVFICIIMAMLCDAGIMTLILPAGVTSKFTFSVVTGGLAKLFDATWTLWSVALAVLGVSIKERSKDKALATGCEQPSIVDKMLGAIKRK